jgi:6-phosphogluconolactonase
MKSPATFWIYVGTYADAGEESILLYELNTRTGELTHVKGFIGGKKPSYMTFDKNRQFLYAVNEQENYLGRKSGAVSSFAVEKQTGYLHLLNRVPSHGSLPVYITMGQEEKTVLVANYSSGNIAVLPVLEDGRLAETTDLVQHEGVGPNKERQQTPHVHCIMLSPDERFVFAVDLGTDKVMRYHPDTQQGKLVPTNPAVSFVASAGTGPRHMRFHPNGRFSYLIHELKSVISVLSYDSLQGSFSETQTIATIPGSYTAENKCSGIKISPDGKFLYGSNRGHNSIVVYAINESSGLLTLVEHVPSGGDWPREFALAPTGEILLVANQKSDTIISFKIDKSTGRLTPTGYRAQVEKPVFLEVVPTSG